ncbi:MAG TPA: hypothetical protein VFV95_06815 [Vicinamibacterales bacterium]|nr:hypothetical protein [Vicinamibacterales bacterium]
MTRLERSPREVGGLLLRVAALIFDECALSTIVRPAIADMQHEINQADTRGKRLVAYVRGLWALAKLAVVVPFEGPQSVISGGTVGRVAIFDERVLTIMFLPYAAGAWMFLGELAWAALAGGVLLGVGLRWWHNRHPARIPAPMTWLGSDINFSSIPVGGNAGGLICMIGCAAILVAGMPAFAWFLAATSASGALLAGALFAWHGTRAAGRHSRSSLLGRA